MSIIMYLDYIIIIIFQSIFIFFKLIDIMILFGHWRKYKLNLLNGRYRSLFRHTYMELQTCWWRHFRCESMEVSCLGYVLGNCCRNRIHKTWRRRTDRQTGGWADGLEPLRRNEWRRRSRSEPLRALLQVPDFYRKSKSQAPDAARGSSQTFQRKPDDDKPFHPQSWSYFLTTTYKRKSVAFKKWTDDKRLYGQMQTKKIHFK